MALLREGLASATKATQRSEIYGEFLAIDTALSHLQAGELCLVLVDQVPEAIAHIEARIKAL
jgi:cyanophycin synthetase